MAFDYQEPLRLSNGMAIPESFFRSPLDRMTRSLMQRASRHICLYRGNPFYVHNRPSLYDHNQGLLDALLGPIGGLGTLAKGPAKANRDRHKLIVDVGRKLMPQDDDEILFGEILTMFQKVKYPHLQKHTVNFKPQIALLGYAIACCYALKDQGEMFLENIAPLRDAFQGRLDALAEQEMNEEGFRLALSGLMVQAHNLYQNALVGLTPGQLAQLDAAVVSYEQDYLDCTDSMRREKNVAALMAQVLDKNSSDHIKHGVAQKEELLPGELPLHEEPDDLVRKTIRRSEGPLLQYLQCAKTDPAAAWFAPKLAAYTATRIGDYVALTMPVEYTKDTAKRIRFHAEMATRTLALADAGIYPDSILKKKRTNHELFQNNFNRWHPQVQAIIPAFDDNKDDQLSAPRKNINKATTPAKTITAFA